MADGLEKRIGSECELDDVNRGLRETVRGLGGPVVGALHVTCADEAEWECVDSFQRVFVAHLLPKLKFACRAPFRLTNLGGRYEPGALAVAEHHFATPQTQNAFKVLLVKINAHVAVEAAGAGATFGQMQRYEAASSACGALHAVLEGKRSPAFDELRATFSAGGVDRLAALTDPARVDPKLRSLVSALVGARLQARAVEADIERHMPRTPTVYVLAWSVTLNRTERDTEIPCGLATYDRRDGGPPPRIVGFGDDPVRYRLADEFGRLRISEA
jgi:hypothetical protein